MSIIHRRILTLDELSRFESFIASLKDEDAFRQRMRVGKYGELLFLENFNCSSEINYENKKDEGFDVSYHGLKIDVKTFDFKNLTLPFSLKLSIGKKTQYTKADTFAVYQNVKFDLETRTISGEFIGFIVPFEIVFETLVDSQYRWLDTNVPKSCYIERHNFDQLKFYKDIYEVFNILRT